MVYANAIYVTDLATLNSYPAKRLFKLVTMLHNFYKSYDLCLHILTDMQSRGMAVPLQDYRARPGLTA